MSEAPRRQSMETRLLILQLFAERAESGTFANTIEEIASFLGIPHEEVDAVIRDECGKLIKSYLYRG